MAAPRRILFVRTDRLGEVLLNLPAIMALRAAYPHARLSVLVDPELKQLLSGLDGVDAWLDYRQPPGRTWWMAAAGLAREWRARRFDLTVISNPKKEFHAAAWLAGIPVRVGYDRKWGCLLTHRLPDRKSLGERHEVEYNLELIRAAGAASFVPVWRMPAYDAEAGEVAQLLERQGLNSSEPLVAIHPWSSNPRKEWPADRFRALIKLLRASMPVQIVVIGGPQERQRVADVLPQADLAADRAGTILAGEEVPPAARLAADLVGRLTLRQLAALLKRSRLLISNDSGPVHLAAAMGTRTVVVFAAPDEATGPRRWGPWGAGHRVIWKRAAEGIEAEEVFAAVKAQLA